MPTINDKLGLAMLASSIFFAVNVQAANTVSCAITENTAIVATTTHLTDNVDGTISDPESGLIWKKCSEGLSWSSAGNNCTGAAASIFNWQEALQRAQAVNDGSTGENFTQTDWRLPNVKELATIVELRCYVPPINNTVFPQTTSFHWSSSPYALNSARAWGVSFFNGIDIASVKGNDANVRLVRSGQ